VAPAYDSAFRFAAGTGIANVPPGAGAYPARRRTPPGGAASVCSRAPPSDQQRKTSAVPSASAFSGAAAVRGAPARVVSTKGVMPVAPLSTRGSPAGTLASSIREVGPTRMMTAAAPVAEPSATCSRAV
jgi:hypothetical protein